MVGGCSPRYCRRGPCRDLGCGHQSVARLGLAACHRPEDRQVALFLARRAAAGGSLLPVVGRPARAYALAGVCVPRNWTAGILAFDAYLGLCWLAAAVTLVARLRWMLLHDVRKYPPFPPQPQPGHGPRPALARPSAPRDRPSAGQREPGIGSHRARPRRAPLAPALEGLSVVHLSDFHFTGKVGKPFFEEIVRMSNALEPEIVAVTGDLVDKTKCIDWVARHPWPTEGPLRSLLHLWQSRSPHR